MYGLTKKQLSVFTTVQEPFYSYDQKTLSRPVVYVSSSTGYMRCYSIKFFKHLFKTGGINSEYFTYHLLAVL